MILDAQDLIVGRLATVVAKRALLGETVDIVNCEKAVITGARAQLLEHFRHRRARGTHRKGPFAPRSPDRIVRRVVRGMLPYKNYKGSVAYKRVMCYVGVPEKFQGKSLETIKEAHISKMPNMKYLTIGELYSR